MDVSLQLLPQMVQLQAGKDMYSGLNSVHQIVHMRSCVVY